MPSYTVHVPRDGDDALQRADRTAFVRDGFSIPAFLFGPFALLRWRAWTAAAAWVAVVLGGAGLCHVLRLPAGAQGALLLLVALFTGVEAATLRRSSLERRGLVLTDVIDGAGREDAERAFFRNAVAGGLPARATVGRPPARRDEPVIGWASMSGPER